MVVEQVADPRGAHAVHHRERRRRGRYRRERAAAADDEVAGTLGGLGPFAPHAVETGEIVSRCILALINEGARVLGEGIAESASDIDVIWCNGYGFPRNRGGPMFYADTLGLAEVVGSKPIPRTEVTKRLWAYIKKNGLQDKKNKRMINADSTLKAVFGGKSSVNMFEMTKLVNKHLK